MDDDLLRALGRHQREDLDAPEERLEADDAWHDAARPWDDTERDRMLDAVLAAVDAGGGAGEAGEADGVGASGEARGASELGAGRAGEASTADAAGAAGPAGVASIERARRRRSAAVALVLGLAAVLALVLLGARYLRREPAPELARLPEYATTQLRGGAASQRGDEPDPAEAIELGAGDEIDWIVTPAVPVRAPVEVALLAEPAGGGAAILVPRVDAVASEVGVVRLRGRLDRFVSLAPGSWTLTLLVAGPGELPRELAQAQADPSRWRRASIRVTVAP